MKEQDKQLLRHSGLVALALIAITGPGMHLPRMGRTIAEGIEYHLSTRSNASVAIESSRAALNNTWSTYNRSEAALEQTCSPVPGHMQERLYNAQLRLYTAGSELNLLEVPAVNSAAADSVAWHAAKLGRDIDEVGRELQLIRARTQLYRLDPLVARIAGCTVKY